MTAPGKNIEFLESEQFKIAAEPLPELRERIIEHLEAWPRAGDLVAKGVRLLELVLEGRRYAVIYRRVENRMGLMHLFQLPQEQALMEERVEKTIQLFGKGGEK